jgi:hypothetical protein
MLRRYFAGRQSVGHARRALYSAAMTLSRSERAERLGPYFEAQLRFAARMAELTDLSLGEAAFRHTNLNRRFGLGIPVLTPPTEAWLAYAARLEAAALPEQVALTQDMFRAASDERLPLPGQTGFGCFAFEPPKDGAVKIHFNNKDTDAAGGPLATTKIERRQAELAAMTRHIAGQHPGATHITGRSWLYNLEAYRRLFPPNYVATRELASTPVHLSGTSSWGQLIDSREAIRPEVRDALLSNLATLDPQAPWTAFPLQVLSVQAPLETFREFYDA